MQLKWRRRLITMRKIVNFDPAIHSNVMVRDPLHVTLTSPPQVQYDPFNEAVPEPAHANFPAKRMNDPSRAVGAPRKARATLKGGWTSTSQEKRKKRLKLNQQGEGVGTGNDEGDDEEEEEEDKVDRMETDA